MRTTLIRLLVFSTAAMQLTISPSFAQADRPSIRWMVTVDKSDMTGTPGELRMLGDQPELVVRLGLSNSGPPITISKSLDTTVRVRAQHQSAVLDVAVTQTTCEPPGTFWLDVDGDLRCEFVVRRADAADFVAGRYELTVDLSAFLSGLAFQDGTLWAGTAKPVDARVIAIDHVTSREDRIHFLSAEGNYHLTARRYREAIPYLEELVQLTPANWQATASLGTAYARAGRTRDAVQPLERAMAGRPDNNVVAYTLAAIYVALGSEPAAIRTLRARGLSEREAAEWIRSLRARRR